MLNKLIKDEAGSPTVESIFWIVIFVGAMIVAVTLFTSKMKKSLTNQGDTIVNKSYDSYCATKYGNEHVIWDSATDKGVVAEGSTPTCKCATGYAVDTGKSFETCHAGA